MRGVAATLVYLGGLVIFWIPPVVSTFGSHPGNGIVLLTPLALIASIVWAKVCIRFSRLRGIRDFDRSLKTQIFANACEFALLTAIGIADGFRLHVFFLIWTIGVVVIPFGVWYNNRLRRAIQKRPPRPPPPRIRDWL
jgi:preprotein translocase subunit SecY